ncbi:hypothetical protein [Metabacillus litoralis]|uniref:hypothetical protein n=1 Tax=Metabacillus litoralis TaxID=152268 RepID=UPI00203EB00B|nr:hypothetical protein [Metabacillus litoralis]MCM3653851.1 hypothetical protein [Metabacillus litoralis]
MSEVYQLKGQAEQQTIAYLTFKKNQEEARKRQAEIEVKIEARKSAEAEFAYPCFPLLSPCFVSVLLKQM